jgi:ribonucleoside-diphosphate reductase alpha chain
VSAVSSSVANQDQQGPPRAVRHRLPDERASLTHKFSIAGHEGYITVGLYPNGQPGEIFIRMAKEGSTISGLMDSFATAISLALQHGVPLKLLCEKFAHSRFEPSGWTGSETLGYAKSIMDYLFRWIELRFLSGTQLPLFAGLGPAGSGSKTGGHFAAGGRAVGAIPVAGTLSDDGVQFTSPQPFAPEQHAPARGMGATSAPEGGLAREVPGPIESAPALMEGRGIYHAADAMRGMYDMGDAPSCLTCGAIMVRSGSCYRCMSCGSTSGCS